VRAAQQGRGRVRPAAASMACSSMQQRAWLAAVCGDGVTPAATRRPALRTVGFEAEPLSSSQRHSSELDVRARAAACATSAGTTSRAAFACAAPCPPPRSPRCASRPGASCRPTNSPRSWRARRRSPPRTSCSCTGRRRRRPPPAALRCRPRALRRPPRGGRGARPRGRVGRGRGDLRGWARRARGAGPRRQRRAGASAWERSAGFGTASPQARRRRGCTALEMLLHRRTMPRWCRSQSRPGAGNVRDDEETGNSCSRSATIGALVRTCQHLSAPAHWGSCVRRRPVAPCPRETRIRPAVHF